MALKIAKQTAKEIDNEISDDLDQSEGSAIAVADPETETDLESAGEHEDEQDPENLDELEETEDEDADTDSDDDQDDNDDTDAETASDPEATADGDTITCIAAAEQRCRASESRVNVLKENLKEAKKEYDGDVIKLRKLCAALVKDEDRPLFNQVQTAKVVAKIDAELDAADAAAESTVFRRHQRIWPQESRSSSCNLPNGW